MSFVSMVGVELKKIRRSKILLILLIPVIMMWIPGIINVNMNFDLRGIPITPENNFFIQGLRGWCNCDHRYEYYHKDRRVMISAAPYE